MRRLHADRLPRALALDDDLLVEGDNLAVLPRLPGGTFDVAYLDPPFGTGRTQRSRQVRAVAADGEDGRTGFGGRRYRLRAGASHEFPDRFDDYLAFLAPRLEEVRRVLADHGTLYLHLDFRQAHAAKLLLDELFGEACFLNELIWAYDYGAKSRRRWPAKHDTILVYVKDPKRYLFDSAEVDREPYMAPGLVTAEKAARGKLPVDVWWHTIVPTSGTERTGWPTQKPEGIVRRMVAASSRPGGWCLDPFAGSGTLGAVAARLGRRYVLVDEHPEAIAIAERRLREVAAA